MTPDTEKLDKLIGMYPQSARITAKSLGFQVIVCNEIGARVLLTSDFNPKRIRLIVEHGKVVSYSVG